MKAGGLEEKDEVIQEARKRIKELEASAADNKKKDETSAEDNKDKDETAEEKREKAEKAIRDEMGKSSVTAASLGEVVQEQMKAGGLEEKDEVIQEARKRIKELEASAADNKDKDETAEEKRKKAEKAIRDEMGKSE